MDQTPDEILGLIFEWCPTSPFPALDPITKPEGITILMVSREWRRIALSTPSLWCQLRLETPYPAPSTVSEYLALSGCLPLDVELMYPRDRAMQQQEVINQCNASHHVLLEHVQRFKSLVCHVHIKTDLANALHRAHALVNLALRSCTFDDDYSPKDMNVVLPNLERLTIIDVRSDLMIPVFTAPRLQHLTFERVTTQKPDHIHSLLTLVSKNLRTLRFVDTSMGKADFSCFPPVDLPAIQTVAIVKNRAIQKPDGFFEYPAHVIQQIEHRFQLVFQGFHILFYMREIRSMTADCLTLLSDAFPSNPATRIFPKETPWAQGEGIVSEFFKSLPNLRFLRLRGYNDEAVSLLARICREGKNHKVNVDRGARKINPPGKSP
jgi:hypothetical protein